MASPTPSLDSLTGATNSISSLIDQTDYNSLSDSPIVSDCSGGSNCSSENTGPVNHNHSSHNGINGINGLNGLNGHNGLNGLSSHKCSLCNELTGNPKVLPCFHTLCQNCVDSSHSSGDKIDCLLCEQDGNILSSRLLTVGINDLCVNNYIENLNFDKINSDDIVYPTTPVVFCTSCKTKPVDAVARCYDCDHYLCPNCVMAHQFMHCFEGHRVINLENGNSNGNSNGNNMDRDANNKDISELNGFKNGLITGDKVVFCPRHKTEVLKYFCRSCNVPVCKECTLMDHPSGIHDCEHLSEAGPKQLEFMSQSVQEGKTKAIDIRNVMKNLEHSSGKLQVQYHKAQNEINDTFQFYRSMLEERKQELLKELESVFSAKQISMSVLQQKGQETIEKIHQTCDFVERLLKFASTPECLMFKKLLDSKLQSLMNYNPDAGLQAACELEFVSNYQAIQVGVRNTFGYVRSNSEVNMGPNKQPPIARPSNGTIQLNGNSVLGTLNGGSVNGILERPYTNGLSSPTPSPYESNIISKRFSAANSLGPFSTTITDLAVNGVNPYEKWSNGSSDIFQSTSPDYTLSLSGTNGDSVLDLTSKLLSTGVFPPKSQIKRQKMIYHCKFGEFGVLEGQFTEPSGVAVNAQNDIIVADTNNHRIQIFDKEGRFKFQFGECGKRDGQLLYPNRVAVVKNSGDIIVTERSPTHQIQIYNQYGQFVRKFGANILQHPRGVTVDNKGRIVVVECKVMRVIIFDQAGNVLQKFGCSKHLEFPNGVVVNDKQEIFISDNRAHCVKVFNYDGVFLRQIGSEGVTNYPIGVGINAAGEILIADNHNNFNLTIFTQDGQLVSALESKVKHAQCFDVALMDDGSVVLASKDYRLYIYRYVQCPPISL
ncbi:unnamed protein product [Bemisia tabaci]|uniref:Brain tumor protein n=1 Tax=Bemisia tabaci TaxID=7038 RepID=A0A9P0F633_BEMTA|nr:unnamed protein product [Bemisia tabaci]